MNTYYLSVGSNVEEKIDNLIQVYEFLKKETGIITGYSNIYETLPWGFSANSSFLNIVFEIKTDACADNILKKIKNIENKHKRIRRKGRYDNRLVDIDILFCDDMILINKDICIPHPLFHLRTFCIRPMMDINKYFIHPVLKISVENIYNEAMKYDKSVELYMSGKHLFDIT